MCTRRPFILERLSFIFASHHQSLPNKARNIRLTTIALQQTASWQEILSGTVREASELCRLLELDKSSLPDSHPLLKNFPVRVPGPYLSRIKKGCPDDPLLLQVFPDPREAHQVAGYSENPLQEDQANPLPGILHKYNGRALLLATGGCAIHCRYCFRRHFPYEDQLPGKDLWQHSLEYIRDDNSINEIILSGGDPLTLPDRYLAWFLDELSTFSHVRRIRIHTRLPIMIPERITAGLSQILANSRFRTIVVLHSNHAQEFDVSVDEACNRLQATGAVLLNQSVLLKGVNDSAETLVELSERLFSAGVLPYYLHVLDKVQGAAHFDLTEAQAIALVRQMQTRLPGYLVPRLVREVPGEGAKSSIDLNP